MCRIEDLCLVDNDNVKNSPRALFEIFDQNFAIATGKCWMHNIWFQGERTKWGPDDDDTTIGIYVNGGGGGNNADESTFRNLRFHEVPYPFLIANNSNQSVDFLCEHWWVANARTIFEIGAGGHLIATMITFNDNNNPGTRPMVFCDLRGRGNDIGSNTDSFVFNSCKSDGGANYPGGIILVRNTNPHADQVRVNGSAIRNQHALVSFRDLMLTHTDTTGQVTPYIDIEGGSHVILFENCRRVPRKTHAADAGFARMIGLDAERPARLIFIGGYPEAHQTPIFTGDSVRAEYRTIGVERYDGATGAGGVIHDD
jgi:hypothetical protein